MKILYELLEVKLLLSADFDLLDPKEIGRRKTISNNILKEFESITPNDSDEYKECISLVELINSKLNLL